MNDKVRKNKLDNIMGGLLVLNLLFFVIAMAVMRIDNTATVGLLPKAFVVFGVISGSVAGYILITNNKGIFR